MQIINIYPKKIEKSLSTHVSACSEASIYIISFENHNIFYFIINIVGGEGLKKEYYQIDLTRGEGGSNFSSAPAQHNDDSPDIETEEEARPRSPRSEHSLEDHK